MLPRPKVREFFKTDPKVSIVAAAAYAVLTLSGVFGRLGVLVQDSTELPPQHQSQTTEVL